MKIKNTTTQILSKTYKTLSVVIGEKTANKLKSSYFNLVNKITDKNVSSKNDLERLRKIAAEGGQLKLHFGCGPRILKGWINIDLAYQDDWNDHYASSDNTKGTKEDFYQINFNEGQLPLPDNSVDAVFSEDFVEHLGQKETIIFLSEAYRILKAGGINRINTPNLIASMKKHSEFSKGYDGVFQREWDKNGHINILTPGYLKELAEMIGYGQVFFTGKNQSRSNLIPLEVRPGDDREESEQIYCDLIK